MSDDLWFDDLPVIGEFERQEDALKETYLTEDDSGDAYLSGHGRFFSQLTPLWKHTTHLFGYIPLSTDPHSDVQITSARTIAPDPALKRQRIKIGLDHLSIASYPGGGTHQILFDFYAQSQQQSNVEHLHFNATFRVREGEDLPTSGCPIFVGLKVGNEGVMFKCYTVNIQNDEDEDLIRFLETEQFRNGLKLVAATHPAVALVTQISYHLTRTLACRGRNQPVQNFFLGLDFTQVSTRARLREGSYLVVQLSPEQAAQWAWEHWTYNRDTGLIHYHGDMSRTLGYNYFVFSVSRL